MRLIDADALAELLKREAEHHEADGLLERSYGVLDAYMDVLQATTVHPEQPKMGKWVEVHGWATPGGDPVWACSECGKGLHVYGIEHGTYGSDVADGQWVACPNCGAQMEEEDDTVD